MEEEVDISYYLIQLETVVEEMGVLQVMDK